ncbi:hypothetical protein BEP19_15305 [Ammoniphilus oxalaticus]|uniref:Uncharacterized protein n=1 Tax=Ammoniphilus oxalaticus TaxID=66863 RepID=A0A419SD73_9BACL|nr:hypothetical protein [Ammoniphilus oxalaticus]RKD21045.1 hypothetical protein BEP19_15305 [Ammoniphilus oxalaticus]
MNMDMNEIFTINSIPVLENALESVQRGLYESQGKDEMIALFQKDFLIRVRIKQIEKFIHS